jgi:hypothetical protein
MRPATIIAAAIALSVAGNASARSQLDDAIDFAAAIYRHLPAYDQQHAPYAPRLATLIARDTAGKQARSDAGVVDWMPLCGCQDFPERYRLTNMRARSTRPGAVSVIVTMMMDKPATVTLDLVHSGDSWLIADVHDAAVPSLVAHLTRNLPR